MTDEMKKIEETVQNMANNYAGEFHPENKYRFHVVQELRNLVKTAKEPLQAKLDVAIEAFEFMIDSWMSGTVTQYEIRKRAEEALEKLK